MPESPEEEDYSTVRDLVGEFIGKRVVDITQHDPDEWAEEQKAYVMLMFEDGTWLQFFIGENGFRSNRDDYETDEEDQNGE